MSKKTFQDLLASIFKSENIDETLKVVQKAIDDNNTKKKLVGLLIKLDGRRFNKFKRDDLLMGGYFTSE